jgi:hypothetical protein
MTINIKKASLAVALALGLGIAQAQASTVTLTLGSLRSGSNIDNYFVGGNDSVPSDGTGPNLGFTFSSNATAQKAGSTASSDGRFENEPSGQGEVLFFSSSTTVPAALNFASGFSAISFDYSVEDNNANNPAINQIANTPAYQSDTVDVWSGVNGTGSLLGQILLTPVASPVACQTRGDLFCNWQQASISNLPVTAESVTFGPNSASAFTEFDGVQVSAVPLPASAWLLLSAMGGLATLGRRRQLKA